MNTKRLILSAFPALLCACALFDPGPRVEEPGPGERAMNEAIEGTRAADAAVPKDVQESLLPPLPGPWVDEETAEPRFDVSVSRSPAKDFFHSLVEGTSYNIVLHPDVKGRISLELKSVTISEVLEAVQHVYGYSYRETAGAFFVMPRQLQTRIFEVSYLHIQRLGQSRTRVSSGQVSENGSRDEGGNSTEDDSRSTSGSKNRTLVSGSVIATQSAADMWGELERAVLEILGHQEGRSVVTSPNSGVIVVRAMPGELRQVELFLRSVENSLQRQVILEAKVVEVTLDDGFQSGINWSVLAERGATEYLGSQTGGGTSLADGVSESAGNSGILDPRILVPILGSEASAFGGVFSLGIESDDFSAFIELLETQGDTQVLSSPRVATMNNQKAVIKVGSDEFFVTDISTTTTTGGGGTTTNPSVELTPFFSGIALDVTPQIGSDGFVTLHVHPSVSEIRDQNKTIAIGVDTLVLPLALSTIRETDTIIRARSGQVVVIGGLMQDNLRDQRASVPFASKVPILSSLFEQNGETGLKRELVILLRPVVVEPGVWRRELENSAERLKDMRTRQQLGGRP